MLHPDLRCPINNTTCIQKDPGIIQIQHRRNIDSHEIPLIRAKRNAKIHDHVLGPDELVWPRVYWKEHSHAFALERVTSLTANQIFCETKFLWFDLIAEPVNTISSLGVAIMGVQGMRNRAVRRYPMAVFLFSFLVMVGLGSTFFHATVSRLGQDLDELPMLLGIAGFSCAGYDLILQHSSKSTAKRIASAAAHFLFVCVFLWSFLRYRKPLILDVSFAGCALAAAYSLYHLSGMFGVPRKELLQASLLLIVGFSGWNIENHICYHIRILQDRLVELAVGFPVVQLLPSLLSGTLHGSWHLLAGKSFQFLGYYYIRLCDISAETFSRTDTKEYLNLT